MHASRLGVGAPEAIFPSIRFGKRLSIPRQCGEQRECVPGTWKDAREPCCRRLLAAARHCCRIVDTGGRDTSSTSVPAGVGSEPGVTRASRTATADGNTPGRAAYLRSAMNVGTVLPPPAVTFNRSAVESRVSTPSIYSPWQTKGAVSYMRS
ncbi:MAG: hypothetical protein MNPFHGCM_00239 [Gemmatimonadaceae bacterium]|nr:hypothetical protein [Gemmatimonadaceae bacterium]